jgi:CubicO group peptidase (beta-lactamase class C family)
MLVAYPLYPDKGWRKASAHEAGFDPSKLERAKSWLDRSAKTRRYRVVVVRSGRLVANWNHGFGLKKKYSLGFLTKFFIPRILGLTSKKFSVRFNHASTGDIHLPLASAAKSIFSCILGIVIEEGKLPSADAKIVDYYSEAMDVPEGKGPKTGRYAFEKDHNITFRQLISNTSGYMKPGEAPGKVFHYQTYGMNILTHALAEIYGLYTVSDPDGLPGLKQLVDQKIRTHIGAKWSYYRMNFDLPSKARINIFGYYDGVKANALDMARLGWLWCNKGRWNDKQLIPATWLREATQTAPDIRANCDRELWKYGYGFWTNDYGQLWPSLPRDSFAASGSGSQHIWVCPSLELVVVQSPGIWQDQSENDTGLLKFVLDACH